MNDDGYTLAEALAALAILGLVIGGLGLIAGLIARQQLAAARLHDQLTDARAADRALGALIADADLADLVGDAASLSFSCGGTVTCGARLRPDGGRTWLTLSDRSGPARRLRLRERDVRFGYLASDGSADVWPATSAPAGAPPEGPRVIVLRAGGKGAPLAWVRTWRREPRDCQFDAISGACRAATAP